MNPSEIASELVVILWPQAGYPKIPKTIKRKAQSVIARVAWEQAIKKAESEVTRKSYDWRTKVARDAARATFASEGAAFYLGSVTEPYPFDQMTNHLQQAAVKAMDKRLKDRSPYQSGEEMAYERWMDWAKLSDVDYYTKQADVGQHTRR